MFKVSDSQSRDFVGLTPGCNNSGKVVHMRLSSPSSIILHLQKADVGKAGPMLHWPRITDSVLHLSTSSVASDKEMSTMPTLHGSMAPFVHQNKHLFRTLHYRRSATFYIEHTRNDWLSKAQSHTKHITCHIGDEFLRVKWPNQQCESTEGTHKTKPI